MCTEKTPGACWNEWKLHLGRCRASRTLAVLSAEGIPRPKPEVAWANKILMPPRGLIVGHRRYLPFCHVQSASSFSGNASAFKSYLAAPLAYYRQQSASPFSVPSDRVHLDKEMLRCTHIPHPARLPTAQLLRSLSAYLPISSTADYRLKVQNRSFNNISARGKVVPGKDL